MIPALSLEGEATFNPETHQYFDVNGIEVPSISFLLKHFGFIDDRWFKPSKTSRGSYAHAAISYYLKGEIDKYEVDEYGLDCLKQFQAWEKEHAFKVKHTETPLISRCGFGCTPDLIGKVKGVLSIVEIKTGGVYKWINLQTAAQLFAANEVYGREVDIKNRYVLKITPKGYNFKKIALELDEPDRIDFLALVDCYKVQQKYAIK